MRHPFVPRVPERQNRRRRVPGQGQRRDHLAQRHIGYDGAIGTSVGSGGTGLIEFVREEERDVGPFVAEKVDHPASDDDGWLKRRVPNSTSRVQSDRAPVLPVHENVENRRGIHMDSLDSKLAAVPGVGQRHELLLVRWQRRVHGGRASDVRPQLEDDLLSRE